jgi:hypothetical protein
MAVAKRSIVRHSPTVIREVPCLVPIPDRHNPLIADSGNSVLALGDTADNVRRVLRAVVDWLQSQCVENPAAAEGFVLMLESAINAVEAMARMHKAAVEGGEQ